MNKNLLEQDENNLLEMQPTGVTTFENTDNSSFSETDDTENLLEIPELTIDLPNVSQTPETASRAANITQSVGTQAEETKAETQVKEIKDIQPENSDETLFQPSAVPESTAETARKSGLAYGAAITLFGSVIFLLVIGWFADWLFGTSPWGIIGGIILGAIIGFYQFFRITSQIFKK